MFLNKCRKQIIGKKSQLIPFLHFFSGVQQRKVFDEVFRQKKRRRKKRIILKSNLFSNQSHLERRRHSENIDWIKIRFSLFFPFLSIFFFSSLSSFLPKSPSWDWNFWLGTFEKRATVAFMKRRRRKVAGSILGSSIGQTCHNRKLQNAKKQEKRKIFVRDSYYKHPKRMIAAEFVNEKECIK